MKMLTIAVQVDGRLRDVIEVASNSTPKELEAFAKDASKIEKFLKGRTIQKIVVIPKKLVNIITILPQIHRRCDKCGQILNDFEAKQLIVEYRVTNPEAERAAYPHDFRFCSVKCLIEEMAPRNEYDDAHDWRAASGNRGELFYSPEEMQSMPYRPFCLFESGETE